MPRPVDKSMEIREALSKYEEEIEELDRIALTYLLHSANARLKDLEERIGQLEK